MSTDTETIDKLVEQRYSDTIGYYWKATASNKRAYKLTRGLTVILGALVTLVASLASSEFVNTNSFWNPVFAIGTPVLAASLTIIAGFSQSFHWGAAWQDMVLTAERLQKEHDRFSATKPEERDPVKELAILNDFVIVESRTFFERLLGTASPGAGQAGSDVTER